MSAEVYTISDLATAADVTPRTIRYYTTEGLLPAPDTRGKYALYTGEHLRRLQLIKRLKDAFLPLHEIRARLEQLNDEQVTQVLNAEPPAPLTPITADVTRLLEEAQPAASASDYIARVLANRSQRVQQAENLPAVAGPADRPASPSPALAPASAAQAAQPAPAAAAPVPPAAQPAARATSPMPAAPPSRAPAAKPGLLQRLLRRRPGAAERGSISSGVTWRRIELTPGVELHIREPMMPTTATLIDDLLTTAMNRQPHKEDTP